LPVEGRVQMARFAGIELDPKSVAIQIAMEHQVKMNKGGNGGKPNPNQAR